MPDSNHSDRGLAGALAGRVPFVDALSAEDRSRLLARATIRRLPHGQPIWHDGSQSTEFLFVVSGRVKLVHATAEGREAILDLRGAGQLLCAGVACAAGPYCCSALAHQDVEVVAFPRRDLLALLEASPAAAHAFLQDVASCTVTLCQRVEELTAGAVERRLALLLLRLTDQLGQPVEDGALWIPLALSRRDLAELCNTAVESAIRTMSRLAKDDVIETRRDGFLVRDRAALAAAASGDPGS